MRLIDPNELEKVLRPILTDESCPLHIAAEIDMNLDLMPKVDAFPVVHCKDCIRYHPDGNVWGWCTVSGKMRYKDYCSYGVRKDGDDGQI
jgi:hypothetical protein